MLDTKGRIRLISTPRLCGATFATLSICFTSIEMIAGLTPTDILDRVGALVSNASDHPEFRRQLHRATYVFTDPHLGVGPVDDSDFNIIPTSSDLQIDHRAGLYYISDVRADSAAYEVSIRLGWTLETMNGQPTHDQSLAVFSGLVDTPTDAQLDYLGTLLANVRRVGERQLSFSIPQARRDPPSNPRQSERADPRRHVTRCSVSLYRRVM